jgi:Tol biopolymer transport system component
LPEIGRLPTHPASEPKTGEGIQINTTKSRMDTMKLVGSKTIRSAFSLGIILFLLLSGCGGGDGDDNSTSSPVSNPIATVFLAKENNAAATQLYGSTLDGASIVKLSGNLVSGGNVVDFAISPDGRFVAYLADQETKGLFELYTVPVGGGTIINVSRKSSTILEVKDFAWASNSSRIAFRAFNPFTGNTGGNIELFTNFSSGADLVTVSNFLPVGGNVDAFEWSPTSQLIAYTANTNRGSSLQFRLLAAPPNLESQAFSVSNIPAATNLYTIGEFQWSPNGSIIAFLADIDILGVNELLVVEPVTNSVPVAISGTLVDGGEVVEFSWAPNNSRIAYLADQFEDEKFDLITVIPDVNSLIPNPEPRVVSGDIIGDVIDFAWSPDSSRLAYIADGDSLDVFELYTNVPFGTSEFKVSGDLTDGGEVTAFAWAPDSSVIAYQASQERSNIFELFTSNPSNPIQNVKVSGSLTSTSGGLRDFAAFGWAPDSSRVAYIARQATDFFELYSSTFDGATNNSAVSGPLVSGGNVDSFKWSPDSSRVAYLADQDTINVPELYSSQSDGSDNVKISSGKVENIYDWVP